MGKTIPKRLESFAQKYVPLLRTYLQREEKRDIDKVIREELVKKVQGVIDELNSVKQKLVEDKVLAGLDLLDRHTRKLEKIRDSIRFAARGYSGVFDLEQMADEELNRMLEFDERLFERVGSVGSSVKDAVKNSGDIKSRFSGVESAIKELESSLDERDSYARGRKAGR